MLHVWSTVFDASVPVHIEVLQPAFVLGFHGARPPAVEPEVGAASFANGSPSSGSSRPC